MKRWVIRLIIGIFILIFIAGIFYYTYKSDTKISVGSSENKQEDITFDGSVNIGEEIVKTTDANSFDDAKLNPFEENE